MISLLSNLRSNSCMYSLKWVRLSNVTFLQMIPSPCSLFTTPNVLSFALLSQLYWLIWPYLVLVFRVGPKAWLGVSSPMLDVRSCFLNLMILSFSLCLFAYFFYSVTIELSSISINLHASLKVSMYLELMQRCNPSLISCFFCSFYPEYFPLNLSLTASLSLSPLRFGL